MACNQAEQNNETAVQDQAVEKVAPTPAIETEMDQKDMENPFFQDSTLYFNYPPFDKVSNAHYAPAFDAGMKEQLTEINAIASNAEAATFENTIVAMEKSGQTLSRVGRVFFALASADTNDDIESLRAEYAPKLSAHSDEILLNPALFARVKAIHDKVDSLELDAESKRLIRETYKDFVGAGAQLSPEDKEKLKVMNSELATLGTTFSQNVKKEVNSKAIVLDKEEQLMGLSDGQVASAKEAAKAREVEKGFVLPLLNTSQQPSMSSLSDRAVREQILKTSLSRGSSGGEFDNTEVVSKVMTLRAEAPPAVANAKKEATDLQAMIKSQGGDFDLQAWDWDFYTEKVRAERYNFDESQLKPYLEMNNVLVNGVFFAAEKVFGLTFKERTDLPTYHPDVKVWEVLPTYRRVV